MKLNDRPADGKIITDENLHNLYTLHIRSLFQGKLIIDCCMTVSVSSTFDRACWLNQKSVRLMNGRSWARTPADILSYFDNMSRYI